MNLLEIKSDDSEKNKKLHNLLRMTNVQKKDTVLISDDSGILCKAAEAGICTVFRRFGNKDQIFSEEKEEGPEETAAVITSRCRDEDPEDEWFHMILDHFHGRAHVIAESPELNIRLRESIPDDYDMFLELMRDPEARMAGIGIFGTDSFSDCSSDGTRTDLSGHITECRQAFLAYIRTAYKFQGFGYWTIEDNVSGKAIGWAGFSPAEESFLPDVYSKNTEDKTMLDIGYALVPRKRGRHLAQEAVRLCIQYAVKNLNAGMIVAETEADNAASIAVLQKTGFVSGGTFSTSPAPDNRLRMFLRLSI